MIGADVFNVFLQVLDLELSLQTDSELAEGRSLSLQLNWAELKAALITADLGFELLGFLPKLSGLGVSFRYP